MKQEINQCILLQINIDSQQVKIRKIRDKKGCRQIDIVSFKDKVVDQKLESVVQSKKDMLSMDSNSSNYLKICQIFIVEDIRTLLSWLKLGFNRGITLLFFLFFLTKIVLIFLSNNLFEFKDYIKSLKNVIRKLYFNQVH